MVHSQHTTLAIVRHPGSSLIQSDPVWSSLPLYPVGSTWILLRVFSVAWQPLTSSTCQRYSVNAKEVYLDRQDVTLRLTSTSAIISKVRDVFNIASESGGLIMCYGLCRWGNHRCFSGRSPAFHLLQEPEEKGRHIWKQYLQGEHWLWPYYCEQRLQTSGECCLWRLLLNFPPIDTVCPRNTSGHPHGMKRPHGNFVKSTSGIIILLGSFASRSQQSTSSRKLIPAWRISWLVYHTLEGLMLGSLGNAWCCGIFQITGNTSWADSARDAMKEQCLEEVQRNSSLPKDLADQISNSMCINDCSGHGECVNGKCLNQDK